MNFRYKDFVGTPAELDAFVAAKRKDGLCVKIRRVGGAESERRTYKLKISGESKPKPAPQKIETETPTSAAPLPGLPA